MHSCQIPRNSPAIANNDNGIYRENRPLSLSTPHRRKYLLMQNGLSNHGAVQARNAITGFILFAVLGFFAPAFLAQSGSGHAAPPVKVRFLTDHFPDKPSLSPAFSIPLDPLGFSAPSANYLGARNSFVSLDFLGENTLLFTFRVPGLIHRDPKSGAASSERQIRALVLSLPGGAVQAESLWTVHDRVRYLWPLNNGRFLLRDLNNLYEGDASLQLKPYIDFPGPLLWVELDPEQQYLVTNSDEPVATAQSSSASPPAAGPPAEDDSGNPPEDHPEFVVRVLNRNSGQVLLVSRVHTAIHLPINSSGYLENLRNSGSGWTLNFNYFTGGSKMLGKIDTVCDPDDNFLSDREIFVIGCDAQGNPRLTAVTTSGRTLWITQAPDTQVWPQLTVAANGSRLAFTTLDASHSVSTFAPMDSEDVKEQSVTIFDSVTGDIPFVSPVSPMLDAGGNVALSPSGTRIAILNAGAIQVFDLSPAPPLPPDN